MKLIKLHEKTVILIIDGKHLKLDFYYEGGAIVGP